ncbi:MAG: rod shape-determining protein MreC [Lentimicrobiaceae bacterium]|nr:rod shape-determining protein MreC [Lentimicrobiaceae bacterium]MCB9023985.1 rod shape-determining protein MreC [Lentimicrobiaceae bacterium]MCO5265596.1 rod shape-determining protein MreC [Lentimicrobium sp.]HPG32214.1 rod shape-determining protein MreC [Lentimicrobium sp.]
MRHILAFIWKHNFFFLFLVLEVVSVILIANKSYYQRSVITKATDGITGSVFSTYSGITSYFTLKQENARLANENARLLNQLKANQVAIDTTTQTVTDTVYQQQYIFTVARVISNSTTLRSNYIMLNKGSRQGIHRDMAVINPDGIVGTVVSVSENFSWVMSVLNKHTKISARINRLNQMGTVVWNGGSPASGTLLDIPAHVKVNKGDTITTSGFSHIFPEGIMVGKVEKIHIESGEHFYVIDFRFSADLNSLGNVYVIENLHRKEQLELSKNVIDE